MLFFTTLTWNWYTILERISRETMYANTHWRVINRLALGINSASAWTRIPTFVLLTYSIRRTICVNWTFGPASFVWIPRISGWTNTWCGVVSFLTNGIITTGWRCAGLLKRLGIGLKRAENKWITHISLCANTIRCMANNSAFSHSTASSNTRISTLIVNTCQIIWTFAVAGAFRTAVRWCSDILRHTGTWR